MGKQQTNRAAKSAVASELSKRGYQVSQISGNSPLKVRSPNGARFDVEVHGSVVAKRPTNIWPANKQAKRDNLFYIFAFIPDGQQGQFFIMTQTKVDEAIDKNMKEWIENHPG